MARYAYDVNTTTRLIDVHKQFSGGLKTVDTDDSLGAVFLRQAENVSLSEFGFIEKRYGTFEEFKKTISGNLQAYFEFKNQFIYVVDGVFYVNDSTEPATITKEKPDEWRYPEDVDNFELQTERDMNAVSINNVLYIFTGTYPIYVKEDEGVLNFYWFSIDIPTYNEIVVVGHNLLEESPEKVYGFETPNEYQITGPNGWIEYDAFNPREQNFLTVVKDNFYPKIAFSQNGRLNFQLQTNIASFLGANEFTGQNNQVLNSIEIDSIEFRSSGAGSSEIEFLQADVSSSDFVAKTNSQTDILANSEIPAVNEVAFPTGDEYFKQESLLGNEFIRVSTQKVKTINYINKDDFLQFNNKAFLFSVKDPNAGIDDPLVPINFNSASGLFPSQLWGTIPTLDRVEVDYIRVRIVPVNAEGEEFDENKVVLTGADVTLQGNAYNFIVPETLIRSENVAQYRIDFRAQIRVIEERELTSDPFNNDILDYPDNFDIFKTLESKIEIKGSESQNFITYNEQSPTASPSLNFSMNNLISGTYDFKITFAYVRRTLVDGVLDFNRALDGKYLQSVYFYNIPITIEKLQDYPGVTEDFLPKLKPIWSCNKVIEHFGKLMVWGSTEMPTAVFYSFPDRPTFFPSKFYLDFTNDEGAAVENVTSYMNILVAQTADRTWGIRGSSGLIDSPAPYVPFTINPTVGTIAYKSVRPVRNHLFFLSKQGIIALKSLYAADEQYNIEFVDRNIKNIVPQDAKAVGIQYDNQYWLNFPENGITLRWYIDKKAWVLDTFGGYVNVNDIYKDKPGAWNQFNGVLKWQIIDGKLEFITYPSRVKEGENLSFYKIGVDYTLPYDLGVTYPAKLETSFLNQNYPFHPKNYKEAKLDFTLQNEYNLSKDAIYSMDTREHISTDHQLHHIDNVSVLKNHTYSIFYNFGTYMIEFGDGGSFGLELQDDIVDGGNFEDSNNTVDIWGGFVYNYIPIIFGGELDELFDDRNGSIDGGNFNTLSLEIEAIMTPPFDLNDIDGYAELPPAQLFDLKVEAVTLTHKTQPGTIYLSGDDIKIIKKDNYDYIVEFYVPNALEGEYDIFVYGNYEFYDGGAFMYDTTYDDSLTFKTWIISENETLNLDNYDSYDQSKADVGFDLKDRLGFWTFGSSDFGNTVTAVKTIKLAGKGYNSKVYIEDFTNSKWTLESMGITYKMKRARSR